MMAMASLKGRGWLVWVIASCSRSRARAEMHVDFQWRQRLPALRAYHHGIERLSARFVLVQPGPTALIHHVHIPPMHDRHDDRIEIEPLLREDIFVPLGTGLVWDTTQNAMTDELPEPVCEHMARHSKPCLKIFEPTHAQKAVAQHEERPPVADDRDGAGNRALLLFE